MKVPGTWWVLSNNVSRQPCEQSLGLESQGGTADVGPLVLGSFQTEGHAHGEPKASAIQVTFSCPSLRGTGVPASQSVVPGPAASASPGTLLEMQNLPAPGVLDQRLTLDEIPGICVLTQVGETLVWGAGPRPHSPGSAETEGKRVVPSDPQSGGL